jgi:hypothetical protein
VSLCGATKNAYSRSVSRLLLGGETLMDRRRERRIDAALPVRIWGVDSYCRPFMQLASARNISSLGVVLHNVRAQIKPGEILDVQYEGVKAQFRVVWTGMPGTIEAGELGLERLPEEPFIWDVDPARCAVVGNG